MSHRNNYLDLDPTYRDVHGRPLMRMTFDFTDNEHRMSDYLTDRAADIAKAMKPREIHAKKRTGHYSIVPYQTTHNTGGAIMGSDPKTSASTAICRAGTLHNLFVMGACAFPQNAGYNPTGTVGALTYWAARRDQQPVPEKSRPAGAGMRRPAMRNVDTAALLGSALIAAGLRGAAARSGRHLVRADRARPLSDRRRRLRRLPHRRQEASPLPAAARSRRRSAPSIRPTSRPTARPASAPGRTTDFYRAMHEGIGRMASGCIRRFPIRISPS